MRGAVIPGTVNPATPGPALPPILASDSTTSPPDNLPRRISSHVLALPVYPGGREPRPRLTGAATAACRSQARRTARPAGRAADRGRQRGERRPAAACPVSSPGPGRRAFPASCRWSGASRGCGCPGQGHVPQWLAGSRPGRRGGGSPGVTSGERRGHSRRYTEAALRPGRAGQEPFRRPGLVNLECRPAASGSRFLRARRECPALCPRLGHGGDWLPGCCSGA